MNDISEEAWLGQQLAQIREYFCSQGINSPDPLIVEWSLAPKLALWSATSPDGSRQIWVISGDCPTDYLIFESILDARSAMLQFAVHWLDVASCMKRGDPHPRTRIGDPNNPAEQRQLGAMLETRALMLQSWAQQDEIWQ